MSQQVNKPLTTRVVAKKQAKTRKATITTTCAPRKAKPKGSPTVRTSHRQKQPKRSDQQIRAAINDVLDNVRFYIQRDGGDLKFIGYQKGVATIEVLGACVGCALIDVTYKSGVETILKDEVPEVKSVAIIDRSQTMWMRDIKKG